MYKKSRTPGIYKVSYNSIQMWKITFLKNIGKINIPKLIKVFKKVTVRQVTSIIFGNFGGCSLNVSFDSHGFL